MIQRIWGAFVLFGLAWLTPSPAPGQEPPTIDAEVVQKRCGPVMRPGVPGRCDHYDVAIMDLVIQPDAWDGMPIRTKGYLHSAEDFAMLCDTPDAPPASRRGDDCVLVSLVDSPGVAIDPSAGEQVRIEGTFDAGRQGRLRRFSGTITDISRLEHVR